MSSLESELAAAGLLTKPVRKARTFDQSVAGVRLFTNSAVLTIELDTGDELQLSMPDAAKLSEALRDAMATMIINNRSDF